MYPHEYRAFPSQVKMSKSRDPLTLNLNYGVIRNSLLSITITPWARRRQSGDGSILFTQWPVQNKKATAF